ncbi:hypothetical protein DPM13_05190 [Paracoccus mutanolyticus]|uniref:Uncharacterized protein n=1 Tax=Paracoccus mutanolyticus TaxID=1499308 RepID=A0ABN5M4H9_9RHOB|nr:hypothetical protein DPM13_05190 [Paracoccus mutanolyticus]
MVVAETGGAPDGEDEDDFGSGRPEAGTVLEAAALASAAVSALGLDFSSAALRAAAGLPLAASPTSVDSMAGLGTAAAVSGALDSPRAGEFVVH